jgi:predicted AlkP superfamily pyrophosphatase or phosphodiesterase
MAQHYGVRLSHPLEPLVWGSENPLDGVERVVLFLSDGLGYELLARMVDEEPELHDAVAEVTEGRGFVPLTSISPSTTAVALPVYWTAQSPVVSGAIGTQMYLSELSMLGDMLDNRPVGGEHPREIFSQWNFAPESFIEVPSLAELLEMKGVPTHLLLHYLYMGTGLSKMLHRGIAKTHPHMGTEDFWLRLKDVLTATRGQRMVVSVYQGNVDALSHAYGADNRYVRNEIRNELNKLRDLLNDETVQDGQTLVLFAADHGHADVTTSIRLDQDEGARLIRQSMRGSYGGDARFTYLYLRDGCGHHVKDAVAANYSDQLMCIDPDSALSAGLFGPGLPHPDLLSRLGDMIIVARRGVSVHDRHHPPGPVSTHAGMDAAEMLIPLLYRRI